MAMHAKEEEMAASRLRGKKNKVVTLAELLAATELVHMKEQFEAADVSDMEATTSIDD